MRICLVNPNSTRSMTESMVAAARAVVADGTEVVGVTATEAPPTIEGYRDEALAAAAVVRIVEERREGLDAFVIACFGDPGLLAAREIVSVPVVGIAEASLLLATTLGHRFSILTNGDADVPEMEALVRRYGLSTRSAGVRPAALGVAEADEDRDAALAGYLEAGRRAAAEDGAEVLCLGCGPLLGLREELEARLALPVIEAVPAGVLVAESLVRMGLATSRAGGFGARPGACPA